jgi:glycosyltransferase involved in cell wall biosynthesis
MKIFIDARVLNGGMLSGIYEYSRHLIANLLAVDDFNDYVFFLNSFRRAKGKDFFGNKDKTRISLVDYHLPNRLLDLSAKFFSLPKIDRLIKADVFYSPNINILAFSNPSRRILTVHDLSFIHYPEFFGWRERLWHWRQDLGKQFQAIGLVIAVSDFTKKDVIETLRLPEENVLRIYPGVNPFYKPVKFPPPVKPFLFYLGMIEPRKNISGIIKAFNIIKQKRQFKDLGLIIAGDKGWLYDKIFKEAEESPAGSAIRFVGRVSEEKTLELYNTASAFVYPSFFEGFGFPPLEAQTCGLPVIASNRTSFPEILGRSALLVNPISVPEIASAIEAILTNNTLHNSLVSKGFENVKRFNWDMTVRELISICQKLYR